MNVKRPTPLIWDLPLRLFHWSWALAFLACWLTRGDQALYLHLLAGYLFTFLLLFRLAWGFVGCREGRFRAFLYGPGKVLAQLSDLCRGQVPRYPGHTPAGSWAIFVMLALGAGLAVTGLLTLGGEEQQGPLAGLVGFAAGAQARHIHELLAWSLLAVVGIHLAGVLVESRLQRENLPLSMLNGYRRNHPATGSAVPPRRGVALLLSVGLLLFAGSWFRPWFMQEDPEPFLPFPGPELARDSLWDEECGSCHLAYHPSLLPAGSWRALLESQWNHFGEDLSLDGDTVAALSAYATRHAAETTPTEAAWKLLHSIGKGPAPARITETPYWREKHAGIESALWSSPLVNGRYNCDACHFDAVQGWFADSAMKLPTARIARQSNHTGGSFR